MAKRATRNRKTPPPENSAMIRRLGGGFLSALGIFLLVALLSYDPFDPSLNHLNSRAVVKNWSGPLGANLADPLLEFIGIAAYFFAFIPMIWGGILLISDRTLRLWLRLTILAFCLPVGAAAASLLDSLFPLPESWQSFTGFGGYIGSFLQDRISSVIGMWGYAALALLLLPALIFFATGVDRYHWQIVIDYIILALQWALYGLSLCIHYLWNGVRYSTRFIQALFARDEEENTQKMSTAEAIKTTETVETQAPPPPPSRPRRIINRPSTRDNGDNNQSSMDLAMKGTFQLPPLDLLKMPNKKSGNNLSESALQQNAEMLESVLEDFGVQGKIIEVLPGPVVTLYALEPAAGVKSSRVIGLADDIARSMSAISARIAVIPGRNAIGIELPNSSRETVYLKELLDSKEYKQSKFKLPIALGKDIGGEPMFIDLAKTPHMLVAGTTGSGKSVSVNAMILSLLYRYAPDECKFIMVDPKMLELSVYQDIPHLLTPVVTEPGKAVVALKWTVKEMENRYRMMSTLGVRNLEGYNQRVREARDRGEELTRSVQTGYDEHTGQPVTEEVPLDMNPLPFIVVIVDEMADLMVVAGKEIEGSIQRLAQMARAAGIHIILATQRPSVDVITGVIKANFPTRISFQVTSKIDSRTILGEQGAEQLLGMGDMLLMSGGSRITRIHGPFVDDKEVEKAVSFLKKQGTPEYVEDVIIDSGENSGAENGSSERDELFDRAVEAVLESGKASTSYVQRALKIGYNRAANLIDQMEEDGIISPADHVGRRKILR